MEHKTISISDLTLTVGRLKTFILPHPLRVVGDSRYLQMFTFCLQFREQVMK